jgi:hypothetical protein
LLSRGGAQFSCHSRSPALEIRLSSSSSFSM